MRRGVLALALAVGLVGLVGLVGCGDTARAGTVVPRVGLELVGEPSVIAATTGRFQSVVGRVRNTDSAMRTGFVEVTLFDGEGRIVGTASAPVARVLPGEEATYSANLGSTPPAFVRIEARVGLQDRTPA